MADYKSCSIFNVVRLPSRYINYYNPLINTMNDFSALNRTSLIQQLSQQKFDVLVIGGGITGAGIALDAATRGLRVALVEKLDFAWGTSSRSTKLIHGGLRYLKQFEVKLVREVGIERAVVYRNARHIVTPEKMLLPIIDGGSLGKTLSSIGLWIYDYLAHVDKDERRRMCDKTETQQLEPLLRTDILKAGGLYYEYRTDDARLTIETMKTAVANGATCLNYAEVTDFVLENDKLVGVKVNDKLGTNGTFEIRATYIVNAAGPWVDTLRNIDPEGVHGKRLHLTKGVHIVVPREKLPLQQSVYFDTQDKRMCFAIPRFGVTYIGTTDTNYTGDTNRPVATLNDVEYILNATNYMFPSVNLQVSDVISTWAGLRPLIHQDGKSPSELSRKDEIFISDAGLISIAGGKLTGYRKMAERVVTLICKKMNINKPCLTVNLTLTGGEFDSQEDFDKFINLRAGEVKDINVSAQHINLLAHRYGTNLNAIIEKAYDLAPTLKDPIERIEAAEVWYAVHFEMVNNLCDYIVRRTGRLYFERPSIEALLPIWTKHLAAALGWNDTQTAQALAEFEREYAEVVSFAQQPITQ